MALLRASSEEIGIEAGLAGAVGGTDFGEIPAAAELVAFAEAAMSVSESGAELIAARQRLLAVTSEAAVDLAAMTVGAFNGLVRVADATGIPADAGMLSYTADDRATLGLDAFPGHANSDFTTLPKAARPTSVAEMCSD